MFKVLILETGFAITALVAVTLNLLLPEEEEDEEIESLAGDVEDRQEAEQVTDLTAVKGSDSLTSPTEEPKV